LIKRSHNIGAFVCDRTRVRQPRIRSNAGELL